jgi:hypothetical protein
MTSVLDQPIRLLALSTLWNGAEIESGAIVQTCRWINISRNHQELNNAAHRITGRILFDGQ